MKRFFVITVVLVCALILLCGCSNSGSDATNSTAAPSYDTATKAPQNNGTVNDHDGFIGNEDTENQGTENQSTMPSVTMPDMNGDNNNNDGNNNSGSNRSETSVMDNIF